MREDQGGDRSSSNFPLNPGPQFENVGGVLRAHNMLLLQYVVFAYKPNSAQIQVLRQTMPDWTRSAHFDIDAKAAGPTTKDDMRAMMRSLLEERFGMRVHREMREEPVYFLDVVKPGKLGPKLRAHAADDPECRRVPLAQTVAGQYPHQCGTAAMLAPSGPGLIAIGGQNVTMDHFVLGLTDPGVGADRPVVNRTGLPGGYDMAMEWMAESTDPAAARTSDVGTNIFEALKEQMGLKLTPGKAPVEMIVVDRVERPAAN